MDSLPLSHMGNPHTTFDLSQKAEMRFSRDLWILHGCNRESHHSKKAASDLYEIIPFDFWLVFWLCWNGWWTLKCLESLQLDFRWSVRLWRPFWDCVLWSLDLSDVLIKLYTTTPTGFSLSQFLKQFPNFNVSSGWTEYFPVVKFWLIFSLTSLWIFLTSLLFYCKQYLQHFENLLR